MFDFCSPEGKKFRSRTELERYVLERGLSVDPASIDFTVRGKANTKKTDVVRQTNTKVPRPPKEKKEKVKEMKIKPIKDKPTTERKSPQKSPKGRTLTQKLVIKMNFSTPTKRKENEEANDESKQTKGVKRKAENQKQPAAKKAKIVTNGKVSAVKSNPKTNEKGKKDRKMIIPTKNKSENNAGIDKKRKMDQKLIEEQQLESESEEDGGESEEEGSSSDSPSASSDDTSGKYEEVSGSEEEGSESEDDSENEAESESDSGAGVIGNDVDASDYRYSLEDIALNQVNSDDSDEDIVDDDDDVDVENYEAESPVDDQLESSDVEENEANIVEDKGKKVHNREDLSVLERLEKEVSLGDHTYSGTYAKLHQKVVVLPNPDVLSNPNIIIGEYVESNEEVVQGNSGNESKVIASSKREVEGGGDIEKVERLLNVTEGMTVQDAYEASVRLGHFSDLQAASVSQRRSSRGTPSKYGNSARRSSYEKTKQTSDIMEWESKRPRRTKSESGNRDINFSNNPLVIHVPIKTQNPIEQTSTIETNLVSESSLTLNKPVVNVSLSPRLSKTIPSDNVSSESSRRRKSSEIAKSPARSPRSRTVSEPSSRLQSPVKKTTEGERSSRLKSPEKTTDDDHSSRSKSPVKKTTDEPSTRLRSPAKKITEDESSSRLRSPVKKTTDEPSTRLRSPAKKITEDEPSSRLRSPLKKASEDEPSSRLRSPLKKASEDGSTYHGPDPDGKTPFHIRVRTGLKST